MTILPCKKIVILLYSPLLSEFLHPSISKEKPMKRFVMTVALACALSGTALAGNIPTSGAPSPSGETQGPGVVASIILMIISLAR
jgi:hypothetical protein